MDSDLVVQKLDTLIKLQAHLAVTHLGTQNEKVLFLGRAGLSTKDIADILGTTPNTVSVALSTARKKGVLKPAKARTAVGSDGKG